MSKHRRTTVRSTPARPLRAFALSAAALAVTAGLVHASPTQADPDRDHARAANAATTSWRWSTRVGSTVYEQPGESTAEAYERVRDTFGGVLGAVRVFSPKLPASWDRLLANYGPTPLVVSFKANPADVIAGRVDSQLLAWFRAAPTSYVTRWSYWHEPEDDVERGSLSPATYRQAWQHISALADSVGNPKLRATLILMCWTLERNSGRNWLDYYPGDAAIDLMGYDCYNAGHRNGVYRDPYELLHHAADLAAQTGKPWGVAELGSVVVAGDDGSRRASWLRATADYARNNGARFMTYFNSNVGVDYQLRDAPSREAWSDAVQAQFR